MSIIGKADRTYFCPECGGASVDVPALEGVARCRVCGWEGAKSSLVVRVIEHDMGGAEQVYKAFHNDLRQVFAGTYGLPLLKLLIKWGFVPEDKPPVRLVARYLKAVAENVCTAVIAEREKIAKEKANGD